MNKPISVAIKEFKEAVGQASLKSELPASVLEPIVFQMHQELVVLSEQELQDATAAYDKEMKKNGDTA